MSVWGSILLALVIILGAVSNTVRFLIYVAAMVLLAFLLLQTTETLIWLRDAADWWRNLG